MFSKKKNEVEIISLSEGYFSVKTFCFKQISDDEILKEFIKSKFILWNETENQTILTTNSNANSEDVDFNFHGFYDIQKLKVSDFEDVSLETFISNFNQNLTEFLSDTSKISELKNKITELIKPYPTKYILKKPKEDQIHEWSVFTHHISGIGVNKFTNELILIEFGLD